MFPFWFGHTNRIIVVMIKSRFFFLLFGLLALFSCSNSGSYSGYSNETEQEALEECDNCNGNGYISEACPKCDGIGLSLIKHTEEGYSCPTCHGQSRKMCSNCNGNGYRPCYNCSNGTVRCSYCSGSGRKTTFVIDEYITTDCPMCNGRGLKRVLNAVEMNAFFAIDAWEMVSFLVQLVMARAELNIQMKSSMVKNMYKM